MNVKDSKMYKLLHIIEMDDRIVPLDGNSDQCAEYIGGMIRNGLHCFGEGIKVYAIDCEKEQAEDIMCLYDEVTALSENLKKANNISHPIVCQAIASQLEKSSSNLKELVKYRKDK